MQSGERECFLGQVDLRSDTQEYNVSGFSEMYADHLEGPAGDPVFYGRVLMVIGFAVSALGVGIKLWGPEVIYYYRYSGPTLIQHIQANPGLVAMAGGVLMAWGGKQRNEGIVHPENFLLSRYKFVTEEGRDVSGQVSVRHLGGDNFNVSLNA
nr:hypothetical protein [Pseudomonas sp. Marseille-Q3773]